MCRNVGWFFVQDAQGNFRLPLVVIGMFLYVGKISATAPSRA